MNNFRINWFRQVLLASIYILGVLGIVGSGGGGSCSDFSEVPEERCSGPSVPYTPITVDISPANGATINASSGKIVFSFGVSMDSGSLSLGGSMSEASDGGVWSRTTLPNDTLTISPKDDWDTGIGSIIVTVSDTGGNTFRFIPVTYQIPILLNTFQTASVVIGQANFSEGLINQGGIGAAPNANTLFFPIGAPYKGSLYLADSNNHRVLGFNNIPITNNANADFVIGQNGFDSSVSGISANKLTAPNIVMTAGGRLFVSDHGNNRVLIWNALPTSNVPADVVVGQTDFTSNQLNQGGLPGANTLSGPFGLAVADGRLFVVDQGNHRVLIWNTIPDSDNVPADIVLGQVNFTSNGIGTSATQLNMPSTIWSDGQRLVVADSNNNRVLIWDQVPVTNGASADRVIGQPDFTSSVASTTSQGLSGPFGVHSNGLQVFISDTQNSRLLIFDSFPTSNQPIADRVLGQSDFTKSSINDDDQDGIPDLNPTARTFSGPIGVNTIGNRLFVADDTNNRVLIFEGN